MGLAAVLPIQDLSAVIKTNFVPTRWKDYFVVSAFNLLREIEGSLMLAVGVNLNTVSRTVTIKLCATKTDSRDLTTGRTWSCAIPSREFQVGEDVQRAYVALDVQVFSLFRL